MTYMPEVESKIYQVTRLPHAFSNFALDKQNEMGLGICQILLLMVIRLVNRCF
jgi:hypothetical protein